MTRTMAVGIDVGGTMLRIARVSAEGEVLELRRRPTPATEADALLAVIEEEVIATGAQVPVGIGIAGLVTVDGVVRYGPNIAVRNLSLASELQQRLGVSVEVLNDASAAVLGEHRAGAGRGYSDVVLFTLGTGVGGGIVADNELFTAGGFAGEFGHIIVERDGRACPCGNRGCLEAYASGDAMGRLAAERLDRDGTPSVLRELTSIDGTALTQAAAGGDLLAREVLDEVATWLGLGVGSIINALDPQLVLIGGGAGQATASVIIPRAATIAAQVIIGGSDRTPPPVRLAGLGDDAGVVGAAFRAADVGAVTPDHSSPTTGPSEEPAS